MKNLPKNQVTQFVDFLRNQSLLLAILFAGVFVPLVVFGKIAEDVWQRENLSHDVPLLQFIHSYATPSRDALAVFLTHLGGISVMVPVCAAVVLLFLWRRRLRDATLFALSVGGAAALNLLVKALFARTRPQLWISPAPEFDYGFPSGHAMITMAFAVALGIIAWPTRWRWAALLSGSAFVLAIGCTRLYLGVHFPSDVLAGWCASLIWVTGVALILRTSKTRSGWGRALPDEKTVENQGEKSCGINESKNVSASSSSAMASSVCSTRAATRGCGKTGRSPTAR